MTYDPSEDGEIWANAGLGAALAGGALAGLGQGLGAFGQNQFYAGERAKDRDFIQQLYQLQFKNSLQFLTYQQELAGYRTPGAAAGVNRAGQSAGDIPTKYPGLGTGVGYSPQTTSTGTLSAASQTDPAGLPYQAKTGHPKINADYQAVSPRTIGTQTQSSSVYSRGTNTYRPPGTPSGGLPMNTPPSMSMAGKRRVNPNIGGLRPPVSNQSSLYTTKLSGVTAMTSSA